MKEVQTTKTQVDKSRLFRMNGGAVKPIKASVN